MGLPLEHVHDSSGHILTGKSSLPSNHELVMAPLSCGGASCVTPLMLECYVAWSFASLMQVTIGAVSSRVWQTRHTQKTTFHRLLPVFQFLHSFPFLFCDAPWVSRTGGKNQILHLGLRTWSHLFWTLWQVMSLCMNCSLLLKEASLTKVERNTDLYI